MISSRIKRTSPYSFFPLRPASAASARPRLQSWPTLLNARMSMALPYHCFCPKRNLIPRTMTCQALSVALGGQVSYKDNHAHIWCNCPLHDDSTPSFRITGTDWKCFVCNLYGDIIDLVCVAKGWDKKTDFKKVLKFLAPYRGMGTTSITVAGRASGHANAKSKTHTDRATLADASYVAATWIQDVAVLRASLR